MKILVVYDSYYGNTEALARAMAESLSAAGEVGVKRAAEAGPADLEGLGLLILGSPTRAFSPSPAAKAFLAGLPPGSLEGLAAAAFDTRIAVEETGSRLLSLLVRIFGYAARPLGRGLAAKGGRLAAPAEGFYVKASEGPLREGELERAGAWARSLQPSS